MASVAADAVAADSAARIRGRVYGVISALLAYPDDRSATPRELCRELTETLRCLPYPLEHPPELDGCDSDTADLQSEYLRLFELPINSTSCGLYGGLYGGDRRSVMEELLRYFRYFGLTVNGANSADLPDSIPTVLEFMQFLCMLEAAAECPDDAAAARSAQKDILARHLTVWAPGLCDRLRQASPLPVFAGTVALMSSFCVVDLAFLTR